MIVVLIKIVCFRIINVYTLYSLEKGKRQQKVFFILVWSLVWSSDFAQIVDIIYLFSVLLIVSIQKLKRWKDRFGHQFMDFYSPPIAPLASGSCHFFNCLKVLTQASAKFMIVEWSLLRKVGINSPKKRISFLCCSAPPPSLLGVSVFRNKHTYTYNGGQCKTHENAKKHSEYFFTKYFSFTTKYFCIENHQFQVFLVSKTLYFYTWCKRCMGSFLTISLCKWRALKWLVTQ